MNLIARFIALGAVVALAGCASGHFRAEYDSASFPLRYVEVDASDATILLHPYADPPPPGDDQSIQVQAIVIKPEQFKGRTIVLRFSGQDDLSYRAIVGSAPGKYFSISVEDGRAIIDSKGWVRFISKSSPRVTPVPVESSQRPTAQSLDHR